MKKTFELKLIFENKSSFAAYSKIQNLTLKEKLLVDADWEEKF